MLQKRNQKTIRFLKKYHKWVSLALTPFIILYALSGIVLNHRELFSPVDVNRNYLPANYSYKNWNMASLKGSLRISSDSVLIYGNIGVWLTDSTFSKFKDFNQGFDQGIDNRKISCLLIDRQNQVIAGTFFGLYRFDFRAAAWTRLSLPVEEQRIVKIISIGDSILVMTRSHLLLSTDQCGTFQEIHIPAAVGSDRKVSLFRTIWMIHSGEIYGLAGKLIMDAVAGIFIFISITGLIYFFVPMLLKRISEKLKQPLKRINKFSLKWHNRFGVWAFVFLVTSALTGIFLRPPLLITIAESRISAIPGTIMNQPNPWFDKFRDIIYDNTLNRFILSTSEGFYYSDDQFNSNLQSFEIQPPVSVMGINVFEIIEPGYYLIGSFSGLFEWDTDSGIVFDVVKGEKVTGTKQSGPPFGAVSVAGHIRSGNELMIFDYALGAMPISGKGFPAMPSEILRNSPLSFWGTCLEIHTGRIFENVTGVFYILIVPITGLAILFILVTGLWLWLK